MRKRPNVIAKKLAGNFKDSPDVGNFKGGPDVFRRRKKGWKYIPTHHTVQEEQHIEGAPKRHDTDVSTKFRGGPDVFKRRKEGWKYIPTNHAVQEEQRIEGMPQRHDTD